MLNSIIVENRKIGPEHTPYLVAELSGNCNQKIDHAKRLIEACAKAGAHAIKLQTYTPDTLTLPARTEYFYKKEGLWKGKYLYELYQEGMTPWEWTPKLKEFAQDFGLTLFSTPFDDGAVDFLEESINPPLYKIAGYEINHIPLLEKVASTNKPVVMSTGMASEFEIGRAVKTLRDNGTTDLILLKCISSYPAAPEDFNLRTLPVLREKFDCLVGLSDHTLTNITALGAVALGACLIEKHVMTDKKDGGIDCGFSLTPHQFAEMARDVGIMFQALGSDKIGPTFQERLERTQRRSIFISDKIASGEVLTPENVKIVRPGQGLCPSRWKEVLGKRAAFELSPGEPLKEGDWF